MQFYKFDGAGNDFVVLDNRQGKYHLDQQEIAHLCHRRFGVGADGLMTLDAAANGYDFEMHYYNSDGRLGSMCGNGGRCIAAFAHMLGMGAQLRFTAYDGEHTAEVLEWDDQKRRGTVKLAMKSVADGDIRPCLDGWFVDTGSPHYVQYVKDLEHYDVFGEGRKIRNNQALFPQGTNVDFIEQLPNGTMGIRTYERGVEDETWACGTGVTAVALVTRATRLQARGGSFAVELVPAEGHRTTPYLIGPVSLNFIGQWTSSQA